MQDIAGCRVVVPDIAAEDVLVMRLVQLFDDADVIDRREKPSYGYRAVHVIVERDDRLIEIQVRTSLQHLWAELSEKLSDVFDPTIKYGGGDIVARNLLDKTSKVLKTLEANEKLITDKLAMSSSDPALAELRQTHVLNRAELADIFTIGITTLTAYKERDNVLPD